MTVGIREVATLPAGVIIQGMALYGGRILIATNQGPYAHEPHTAALYSLTPALAPAIRQVIDSIALASKPAETNGDVITPHPAKPLGEG